MRNYSTILGNGLSPVKYRCDLVLKGAHWPNANLVFDRISVPFPLLNQWTGMANIKNDLPPGSFSPSNRISVSFTRPNDKTVIIDGTRFQIGTGAGFSTKEGGYGGLELNLITSIQIIPREPNVILSEFL